MASVAVVLSLLSIVSRPDGESDLFAGFVWNVLLTGPLWAAVVFLACRRAPTDTKLRKRMAIIAAILAYVVVVCALHGCNLLKMEARESAARHVKQMLQQREAEDVGWDKR
jgi:uncharacterized BrkB/YihY/UPF0761 family membrane protein